MMKKILFKSTLLVLIAIGFTLISCGSDDNDTPTFNNVTLTHKETYTIQNSEGVTWESENKFIASVSGQVVTGHCIGTTTIKSSVGSFKVTVTPVYNNITLPSMNFGATKSTIKSEMNKYTLTKETTEGLLYKGDSPVNYYFYSFSNSAMKYSSILCSYSNFNAVANYVAERYYIVNLSTSTTAVAGGFSPDKTQACLVSYQVTSSGAFYYFAFEKYSESTSSAKTRTVNAEEIPYVPDFIMSHSPIPSEQRDFIQSYFRN